VLRDHDAKFSRSFDDVFRSQGAEMLVTPVQTPNANAYAERWIRTVRTECLDWLLVVAVATCSRSFESTSSITTATVPTGRCCYNRQTGRLTDLRQDDRGAVRRRDLLGGALHEYRQLHERVSRTFRLVGYQRLEVRLSGAPACCSVPRHYCPGLDPALNVTMSLEVLQPNMRG
jgi:hypothetical protein